ncbi:MAG TPA: DivIVA domain-containing protein [Halanaerobiales bacterium]|nr:DivIVA domain-containing protein [Halanaerobiales bacterium]
MKLSPLDIYNKEFNKTTFGYNVKQVGEFLDEVGMAYERLLKKLNQLQDENERLNEKLSNYKETEERLEKVMLTVEETAKKQVNQARKEAELIIKKAQIKAEQIEKEAEEKIQDKYRAFQELRENKELFRIRFRTLLETHLQMLEKANDEYEKQGREEFSDDYIQFDTEEDSAAGKLDLDE